jgi:hypothetical protein
MNDEKACREMPRYACHKEVWALKINAIRQSDQPTDSVGGSWLLDVEEPGYAPIEVSHADYVLKHSPHAGGYYVVYKDGYQSFSPAKAFEDGYTRTTRVAQAERMHAAADECMSPEQREAFLELGKLDPDVYARLFRCVVKRA